QHRVVELAPLVFDAARRRDRVAREILDRVADETVAFSVAAIRRLQLARRDVEVVLGGGVFRANDGTFEDRIRDGIHKVAPRAITMPPRAAAQRGPGRPASVTAANTAIRPVSIPVTKVVVTPATPTRRTAAGCIPSRRPRAQAAAEASVPGRAPGISQTASRVR